MGQSIVQIQSMGDALRSSGYKNIGSAVSEIIDNSFEANAKNLLNNGVKIEKVNGHDASFTILPSDGSYKVSFGEEEFIAFFKEFLRPQLVEMLF